MHFFLKMTVCTSRTSSLHLSCLSARYPSHLKELMSNQANEAKRSTSSEERTARRVEVPSECTRYPNTHDTTPKVSDLISASHPAELSDIAMASWNKMWFAILKKESCLGASSNHTAFAIMQMGSRILGKLCNLDFISHLELHDWPDELQQSCHKHSQLRSRLSQYEEAFQTWKVLILTLCHRNT